MDWSSSLNNPLVLVAIVVTVALAGCSGHAPPSASESVQPTITATAQPSTTSSRHDVRHGLWNYMTPTPGPRSCSAPSDVHITVPILVYHYIRVNPVASDKLGFNLSVTPANFAAQMDYLQQMGAHTVTLADVCGALNGGPRLPSRSVVLTFDDGHDDFANVAVPILVAHGFVGTDFVVSGFLGRSSYMTAQQVINVSQQGMVIGAHTVHHVPLSRLSVANQIYEIAQSKKTLEQLIGKPVLDFAYPYGAFNSSTIAEVSAAGFRDARTTAWSFNEYSSQAFWLPGVEVTGSDSLSRFAAKAMIPIVR